MNAVITHAQRRSRLSRIIESQGGVSVGSALKAAEENLAALRPEALRRITHSADAIAAVRKPSPEQESQTLDALYRHGSDVIDAASAFGLQDLCTVAAGLCRMADGAEERGMDWRGPALVGQTLRLLLALPNGALDQRAALVEAVDDLVRHQLDEPRAEP